MVFFANDNGVFLVEFPRWSLLFVMLLTGGCQGQNNSQPGMEHSEQEPAATETQQVTGETARSADELSGSSIRDYIYSTPVEAQTIAALREFDRDSGQVCDLIYSMYPQALEIVEPIQILEGAEHPHTGKWIIDYSVRRCDGGGLYHTVMTANSGKLPDIDVSRPQSAESGSTSKGVELGKLIDLLEREGAEAVARRNDEYGRFYRSWIENPDQLVQWAVKLGDPETLYRLGAQHYHGRGVEKDLVKAERLFRRAANDNHPRAAVAVALMNLLGKGVEPNEERAVRWFRKAAELGEAEGQFNLGLLYLQGRGVSQDQAIATQWLKKAANQGHARAKALLVELGQ